MILARSAEGVRIPNSIRGRKLRSRNVELIDYRASLSLALAASAINDISQPMILDRVKPPSNRSLCLFTCLLSLSLSLSLSLFFSVHACRLEFSELRWRRTIQKVCGCHAICNVTPDPGKRGDRTREDSSPLLFVYLSTIQTGLCLFLSSVLSICFPSKG